MPRGTRRFQRAPGGDAQTAAGGPAKNLEGAPPKPILLGWDFRGSEPGAPGLAVFETWEINHCHLASVRAITARGNSTPSGFSFSRW
jgi:hypothetical protein